MARLLQNINKKSRTIEVAQALRIFSALANL